MSIPVLNPELSKLYRPSGIFLLVALVKMAQHQRDYMQSGEYFMFVMDVMII